jgi:hypothetical protein
MTSMKATEQSRLRIIVLTMAPSVTPPRSAERWVVVDCLGARESSSVLRDARTALAKRGIRLRLLKTKTLMTLGMRKQS